LLTVAVLVEDGDLAIRRMRDETADYELMVAWRNSPHVRRWWDFDKPATTLDSAIAEYRADTAERSVTVACVIEQSGEPIGFCQFYPWEPYADDARECGFEPGLGWWGVDILIGDEHRLSHGIGTRTMSMLVAHLRQRRGASAVALLTATDNHRAIRAYEKSGFVKRTRVFDTDTVNGQRVECWLMIAR
jgi:aminoglycoside 6'-N-acetyltransferase